MHENTLYRDSLYNSDPTLTEFRARAVKINENGYFYDVLLDRSAFFPGGGGQSADTGTVGGRRVITLRETPLGIVHTLDGPVPADSDLECIIDRIPRMRKMQAHTGEHILSGILHTDYSSENTGFAIGEGEAVTLDTSRALTHEEMAELERKANAVVLDNRKISVRFASGSDLSDIEYRSKVSFSGLVRLVCIDGVDLCACCAPHFPSTGFVGLIKITDSRSWKGGTRLTVLCGAAAYEHMTECYNCNANISKALSCKRNETDRFVADMSRAFGDARFKLRKYALEKIASDVSNTPETAGSIIRMTDFEDRDLLVKYADSLAEKCSGMAFVYSGTGETRAFCAVSKKHDLSGLVSAMSPFLRIRGGGRGGMVSGSISSTSQEIEKYFKEHTNI